MRPFSLKRTPLFFQEQPFAMKKERSTVENRDFFGLAPAIVKEAFVRLSRRRGKLIEYKFYVAPNNHYGSYNHTTGEWNGAMGEIQKKVCTPAFLQDIFKTLTLVSTHMRLIVDWFEFCIGIS